MKLALADADETPASRIEDVVLLRVVPDALVVWIWSDVLRSGTPTNALHLFNINPPVGRLPADLGPLDSRWTYSGIAAVTIPGETFEKNLGHLVPGPVSHPLPPGSNLRAIVDAFSSNTSDLQTLQAVVIAASLNVEALLAMTTLSEHLGRVTVPDHTDSLDRPNAASLPTAPDKLRAVRRLSLWTPGANETEFITFYSPLFGEPDARRMWELNRASVTAVANGQFQRQVDLGDGLGRLVPERSVLAGEASYFKAEGLRLLADIEPNPDRKSELRASAVDAYRRAQDLLPDDPRPLRGLGRLSELAQDFSTALKYFTLAKGLCLTEMTRNSTISELDLAHEILRSTRHFIHCLLDIRASNTSSVWHREHKERELEGYLQQCENLHRECMPKFLAAPDWYYIEWFMGLVFIGKAWGAIGKYQQMQVSLALALDARRRIMRPAPSLSNVERANLQWWLGVARGPGGVFDAGFLRKLDKFDQALRQDGPMVQVAIDEIVQPFVPPWSASNGGAAAESIN